MNLHGFLSKFQNKLENAINFGLYIHLYASTDKKVLVEITFAHMDNCAMFL